jgi:PAS domain S-box-containing protein
MHLSPPTRHMSAEATRSGPLSSAAPVGIFVADADGSYVSVNAHWCEIAGPKPAEARGAGWCRALHPEDRERVVDEWSRATREDRAFESEYRFQRPNGAVIRVLGQALPERNDRGKITGFIGTITDLTQHNRFVRRCTQCEADHSLHNDRLRRLALQIALAQEQERSRIATGLHDEVGQLLAIVQAKLGRLVETRAPGDVAAQAGEIRTLVDRAIGETRALTFELSSPVLHQLGLAAALESMGESLGKESGVQFRVEAEPELEPLPEDLRILLYRAARELCTNVVKHARTPRADVHMHVDGDRIRIIVADDGQGFDASEHTPCFSLAGGYGLFTIREISAQMGGTFEIESAPGKGTRATLSVPLG